MTPVSWLTQVGWAPMDPKALTLPFGALPPEGYLTISAAQLWDGKPRASCLPGNAHVSALHEAGASDHS